MENYISVGITGGIGSGKSYVCEIIQSMGYPVFNSDLEAKNIINSDQEAITFITNLFGDGAYKKGKSDSSFIAEKVFDNSELREKLNQFIHPKVRERFHEWATSTDSKIVFSEAAIFFETGAYKNYDYMVLIIAPHQLKVDRVIKRNNLTQKEVESRMDTQWPDEKKIPLANFVINNDEVEPLLPQIVKMLESI